MLLARQAVVDDDRHFGLEALGAMDGHALHRQRAIQLRLDRLQRLVAPAQQQHRGALAALASGGVLALGADFRQ